ncbi:beta-lactamase family protein [Flammeovirga yaeyamensis]|uniref:Beta-lactamase family protein n=2 Tax=Flammeovirga yaeyamensis TaxID=367791 RepID=A0AAX1NDK0_9BACT|nr:beta-lactamase family protein [Flammeovirga yaeyamensis]
MKMRTTETLELRKLIQTKYSNIIGIEVVKDNKVVFEDYFNGYSNHDLVHVASVTKSIVSLLLGIAIDKGFIKSIDQKILEFFPDYMIKRRETTIQEITIRDLITMTAPYKFKYEPYTKVYSSDDWTKSVLDFLGGKGKIGQFKYTTIGLHVLSGILVSAVGKSIVEFANENLFQPLNIKSTHHAPIKNKEEYFAFLKNKGVSGWVVDPKGMNTAGWGLALTLNDVSKIGQLYLNLGKWKGTQIVSSQWIAESTKVHSLFNELPYGYLWWIIKDETINAYAAIGDGGNIIFISPEKELVISITSTFFPRAKDRIELIKEFIIPMLNL